MDPPAPPPPYVALEANSARLDSDPLLLRVPVHVLLGILSHLALVDLVYAVKPTCSVLYLSTCAVTRSRPTVRRKWANGLARAAALAAGGGTARTRRTTSTGVLDPTTRPSHALGRVASSRTREERIYDEYIVALARYERDKSESFLLLEGGEDVVSSDRGDIDSDGEGGNFELKQSFERDLFGFAQPKARCEDLLIERGCASGWIDRGTDEAGRGEQARNLVREEDIKIELKLKSAKLLLPVLGFSVKPVWKAFVEVERLGDGTIEEVAYRLAREVQRTRWDRVDDPSGRVWYHF